MADPGQTYVAWPFENTGSGRFRLRDLLGSHRYEREGPIWPPGAVPGSAGMGYHVFEVKKI